MTTPRNIAGTLDYSRLFPDSDAVRAEARTHARADLKRALSALRAASEGEAQALRRDALTAAHAAVCDAVALIEATL
ncbi:MAG: hypothetical protein IT483_15425 [Gammaproteobacteria bacterium]|nr:hypothetical protein [Gammaproteobacteria bacterium]